VSHHFLQLWVSEEIEEFGNIKKEDICLFQGNDSVLSLWNLLATVSSLEDFIEMLKELIVTEDFSWFQISNFIKTLLLCIYYLPILAICTWICIFKFYLYGCFNSDLSSLDYVESSGIWILVENDIIWIESLLLKEIIEFENSIIGQLVQELWLQEKWLFVARLNHFDMLEHLN